MPMGGGWTFADTYPFGTIGDSCGDGTWHYTVYDIQSSVPLARIPSGVGLGAELRVDANGCSQPNSITDWCSCHLDPTWPVKHASAFGVWSWMYEPIVPSELLVTATPDTLGADATASLAVRLIDDHGYEVDLDEADGVDDATPVTLTAPADSAAARGLVLGGAAPAPEVTTTYGAARGGAVGYAAGSDSLLYDTPVTVSAVSGGYAGSGRLVLRGTGGAGPDSLAIDLAAATLPCGDSTLVTVRGLLDDAELPLPDSAGVEIARSDSVHVAVSVGGVVGAPVTAAALADSTVYVVTQMCEDVEGELDVTLEVAVDAPWAEGGVLVASGTFRLRPPVAPVLDLVVTPDVLGRGGEAELALSEPVPPDETVTLSVADPSVGGFVVEPPVAVRASTSSDPPPSLATTVGMLPSVRFRVADDAPLGPVVLTAALGGGASADGSLEVSASPALFLRQDNTVLPADSCLMVSRTVPSVRSLPPPPVAYAGAPSSGADPYAYRVEAASTSAGTHTFRVEINPGQPGALAVTYPAVSGSGIDAGRFRTNQSFRLVSNAAPPTGADPGGVYDDAFAGDQTLLVRLGDVVRASLINASGGVVATADQTVGCASSLPTGHAHAVRTAELYVRNYVGVSSQPAVMAERASEDWAQGAVRFEFPPGNVGSDVVGVENILVVQGDAAAAGNIEIDVTAGGAPAVRVTVQILATDSERQVAEKIAAAINAKPSLTAESREFYPRGPNVNKGNWVLTNKGTDVIYSVALNAVGVSLPSAVLHYPPNTSPDFFGDSEMEAIAWNFRNGSSSSVHVFVLQDGSFGSSSGGGGINGRTVIRGDFASKSVVFIAESAMNGDDATNPMTFGHELGHALGVRHYTYSSGPPVPLRYKSNLMYEFSPSGGDNEVLDARKRLVQQQVDLARGSVLLKP